MKTNKESFLERTLIALIMLILVIEFSIVVTFVTIIIFNLPIAIYFGRFNWALEDFATLVLGLSLGLILVDKFRVWVDKQ